MGKTMEMETDSGKRVGLYRRHVYEVVEEAADALFWSACLVPLALSVWGLTSRSGAALLILLPVLLPWGALWMEIVRWQAETYELLQLPNGKVLLQKRMGVFDERVYTDDIGSLAVSRSAGLVDRLIGLERVTLVGPSHQYITGRRMPKRFAGAIMYWKGQAGAKRAYDVKDETMTQVLALQDARPILGDALARQTAQALVARMLAGLGDDDGA